MNSLLSRRNPVVHAALLSALMACAGAEPAQSTGANGEGPATRAAAPATLSLGAYTTPREAYGEILPLFGEHWLAKRGQTITFQESYLASGAQARAIVGGFEADVAALSLEPDIEKIKKAGLITADWKATQGSGMVTRSIVVIGVRKGNPKGIKDWSDLAQSGVAVLTPDVRTSGGAMWNVAAIYGAALRGHTAAKAGDSAAATKLLAGVLRNVKVLDRGARESLLSFEGGLGDAIITYENEILVGRSKGKDYEYVVPKSTILIENPVAVVDEYAKKHGAAELAAELVRFLGQKPAQLAFAKHGLRPVLPEAEREVESRFPAVTDLFTVRDLGDWPELQRTLFDKGAAYDQAYEAASAELSAK